MKKLLIRLDDITPDMNWRNFGLVMEILEKHGIKVLLGVVPDNRDELLCCGKRREDFFDILLKLQEKGHRIAQHGFTHIYDSEDSGILGLNNFSEFAGISLDEQRRRIAEGKKILQRNGIETDIFMAPGHSYDKNTLIVLRELGFHYVTDGFYPQPYTEEGILCIPCTMLEGGKGMETDTLCFHLNHRTEEEIQWLDEFITEYKQELHMFDWEKLEEEALEKNSRLDKEEKRNVARYKMKQKIAGNPQFSEYMVRTNRSNPFKKTILRIICLPVLLWKIFRKEKDE